MLNIAGPCLKHTVRYFNKCWYCDVSDAGAVIHSHSKAAVLATLITPGNEFKITHLEMIKGIKKTKTISIWF